MDRLQSMRVLVKAADTGSFAQAARALNMSPPAVTRAIAYLEDLTGARLFLRSTRSSRRARPLTAGCNVRNDVRTGMT